MTLRRPPHPLLMLVMGVLVFAGFGFAIVRSWTNDDALRDRGRTAPAQVTEVSTGKSRRITVQYRTADGTPARARIGQGDEGPTPWPTPGDTITIVYDPRNPSDDVRDARVPHNHRVDGLVLTVFGLCGIGLPLAAWVTVRTQRRQRPSG